MDIVEYVMHTHTPLHMLRVCGTVYFVFTKGLFDKTNWNSLVAPLETVWWLPGDLKSVCVCVCCYSATQSMIFKVYHHDYGQSLSPACSYWPLDNASHNNNNMCLILEKCLAPHTRSFYPIMMLDTYIHI